MSFEWSHYFDLALNLATSNNTNINQEAAFQEHERTCVNALLSLH